MIMDVDIYKMSDLPITYKDEIDFPNIASQNSFFNATSHTKYKINGFPDDTSIRVKAETLSEVMDYHYVRMYDGDKYYYHYVTSVKREAGVFIVSMVMDVFQTYMFDIDIKDGYMVKGHVDRWDSSGNQAWEEPPREVINGYMDVITETSLCSSSNFYLLSIVTTESMSTADNVKLHQYFLPVPKDSQYWGAESVFMSDPVNFNGITNFMEILNGEFLNTVSDSTSDDIDPETIISMNLHYNWPSEFDFSGSFNTGMMKYVFNNYSADFETTSTGFIAYIGDTSFADGGYRSRSVANPAPAAPTNGATYSTSYEPFLFADGMYKREVIDSAGNVMVDIPYNLANSSLISMKIYPDMYSAVQTETILIGDESNAYLGGMGVIYCDTCSIFSDAWLTYSNQSRDTDRALIASQVNEAWKQAIVSNATNGAMLGSLSGGPMALATTGVGIAGGIASGMISEKAKWAEQDLKEKQLKNQSSSMLNTGNALQNLRVLKNPKFVVKRVGARTLYDMAYEYKSFGYSIDKQMEIDIRSRKFYNYIQTSGINITAPNVDIKQALQAMFDNGMTIWHGDYTTIHGNETDENIERVLI